MDSDPTLHAAKVPEFVEVSTSDGRSRRFAAGTKAGFAIDRINCSVVDTSKRYSFIESIKEGEQPVEFGPDAELVSYGPAWRLRAAKDVVKFPNLTRFEVSSNEEGKKETKVINQPARKVFNPADFYPGGKLPECAPPENIMSYTWNFSLVLGFMFLLAGAWVYLLESKFFMKA